MVGKKKMTMKVEGETTEGGNTENQRKYVTSVLLSLRDSRFLPNCPEFLLSLVPPDDESGMLYQLPWLMLLWVQSWQNRLMGFFCHVFLERMQREIF
jgi:hypothetical protein